MDVRYINPFIEAVQNVFTTMLSTDTVIGKPFLKGSEDNGNTSVSVIIGLSGGMIGMIAMCLPNQTALKLAGKFAGQEMDMNHPDLADALGELLNMVAGQAKSKFDDLDTHLSLPRVITGRDLRVLNSKEPTLVLPCDSTLGRFRLEITVLLEPGKHHLPEPGQEKTKAQEKTESMQDILDRLRAGKKTEV